MVVGAERIHFANLVPLCGVRGGKNRVAPMARMGETKCALALSAPPDPALNMV